MITRTIPLDRYIRALVGCKPYAVIDQSDHDIITQQSDYTTLCIVENDVATIGFDCNPLSQLPQGLYRLWNKLDWEITDNKRRAAVARIDAAHEQQRQRVEQVVQSYISLGMTDQAARTIVSMMSAEMIEQSYKMLVTTATTI